MPTYVYECTSCCKVFEVEQRITDDPLTSCVCGGEGTVKRLIQPTAVLFKGPGFHINDYAQKPASSEKTGTCPVADDNGAPCESCPNAD